MTAHATLYDFRDIDLMVKMAAVGDELGRISATDLAGEAGLNTENGGPRSMGIRLAWMKRYGFVVYDDKEHLWAPSTAFRLGDPVNAHLLRREFMFGTQRR
jgi:hypothetical protein